MANREDGAVDDGKVDDGGAAKEDADSEAGLTFLEGGAVSVEITDTGEERTARHGEDEGDDVPTHDAQGRALSEDRRAEMRTERREEKKRRRNAAREREDRLRHTVDTQNRTISEMTQRLAALEQRGTVGELQNLETKIAEAQQAAGYFQQQLGAAITANDGAAAADFSAKMTNATNHVTQLSNVKQAYLQQKNQPPPLDPRHSANVEKWIADNKWYNRNNPQDPDVRVALAVDKGLADDGWDPTTPAYWTELTKRMKTYLPHRYKNAPADDDEGDDDDSAQTQSQNDRQRPETPPRRPPPRTPNAGGGNSDNSGRAGTFTLSAERVAAMKEAGMWNDTAKRAKMVKRYQEQDRAARGNSARSAN